MNIVEVPIRIVSTQNERVHWSVKANRAMQHRRDTWVALMASKHPVPVLPCIVNITRIAPRGVDSDNNVSGCKNCRDGIADWLGVDDGDARIDWRYAQAVGRPKHYAVWISFEEKAS